MFTLPHTLTTDSWRDLAADPRSFYVTTKTDGVHARVVLGVGQWRLQVRGRAACETGYLPFHKEEDRRFHGTVEGELIGTTDPPSIVVFSFNGSELAFDTFEALDSVKLYDIAFNGISYTLRSKAYVERENLYLMPPAAPGIPIDGYVIVGGHLPRCLKWKPAAKMTLDFGLTAGSTTMVLAGGGAGGAGLPWGRLQARAPETGIGECAFVCEGTSDTDCTWTLVKMRPDKKTPNDPEVATRTLGAIRAPLTEADFLKKLPWGRTAPGAPPGTVIIVPYRDRAEHAAEFVEVLTRQLEEAGGGSDARILIVEQSDGRKFNRGALLNAGFLLTRGDFDWFIFHDVDLLPSDELVRETYFKRPATPDPLHIGGVWDRYKYETYFGGITAFSRSTFEQLNGFPNFIYGWGGEDDVLYFRLLKAGLVKVVPAMDTYRVTDLEDMDWGKKKATLSNEVICTDKKERVAAAKADAADGLSSCQAVVVGRPLAAEGHRLRVLKITVRV